MEFRITKKEIQKGTLVFDVPPNIKITTKNLEKEIINLKSCVGTAYNNKNKIYTFFLTFPRKEYTMLNSNINTIYKIY